MATTPIRSGESPQASGVPANVAETAKEKAVDVKQQAGERMRSQVDSRSTQIGEQIGSFGQALRKAAEQLGNEGKEGGATAANRLAGQVERLAGYMTGSDSDRFLGDAERLGRRRPWLAGGLAAAFGFAASRFLKASSERRYETHYESARQSRFDADRAMARDTSSREWS